MNVYRFNVTSGPASHVMIVEALSREAAHEKVCNISPKHVQITFIDMPIRYGNLEDYLGTEIRGRIEHRRANQPRKLYKSYPVRAVRTGGT